MSNLNEVLYFLLNKVRCQGTELSTWETLPIPNKQTFRHHGQFMFGYVKVGESSTMFTCHLDTVENKRSGTTKKVYLDTVNNYIFANNQVLGADDGAGVALLCHMICNNIAGHYFFFAGEEIGGIGSMYLADNFSNIFPALQLNRAIAFDRKGTSDVVVEQFCGKCCSDVFVDALCVELGLDYKPAIGSFTDTANFVGIIPECTNVSVGYYNEHSKSEYLDVGYLEKLSNVILKVQWELLPVGEIIHSSKFGMLEELEYAEFFADDWLAEFPIV